MPPIIDLETFQRAGRQGRDNQAFAPRNLKAQAYLLRKLVRCGGCGSSCSARTSQQTYGGTIHSSHYYACLRKHSGFLKQERCAQRHIRADVLDDMVWEEVSTRLRDPALLLEACRDREAQRSNAEHNQSSASVHHLVTQIKSANQELSRLLDAYQVGAVALSGSCGQRERDSDYRLWGSTDEV